MKFNICLISYEYPPQVGGEAGLADALSYIGHEVTLATTTSEENLTMLFLFLPIFYFTPEIGFIFSLIMLVLSGHSIFYFIEGWKIHEKAVSTKK